MLKNLNPLKLWYSSPTNELACEIQSFANLEQGWDFGVGDPIASEVINEALAVYEIAVYLGLTTEAMPEINGGIVLTFIHGEDSLEVLIHKDLTYSIYYERGLGENFKTLIRLPNTDRDTSIFYLHQLRRNLKAQYRCKSYEYSTREHLAKDSKDSSSDMPSGIMGMAQYRLCV